MRSSTPSPTRILLPPSQNDGPLNDRQTNSKIFETFKTSFNAIASAVWFIILRILSVMFIVIIVVIFLYILFPNNRIFTGYNYLGYPQSNY
ncbi:hypothetical protein DiNV_CH01M_ORF101 [Drosophila innubila nudivirus]|uniref:Uncharacterized protein n=1 Tax=Drosophila innubila nudivirus TaxID=2057187 RepID=A0A2H4UX87_9VIRU|nr:hypothetical protein DiNV_CH01M_ORF101 [Drosophila innubila nudivirus]ATZ81529.1 hypothetical protein DiNV_CH01M_ORF101 [Drosophila innubila nudivirus]